MKRPALYVLIPLALGIYAATILTTGPVLLFAAGITAALLSLISIAARRLSHVCLYLALFILGMALFRNAEAIRPDDISSCAAHGTQRLGVKGVVVSDPVIELTRFGTWRSSFTMRADAVRQGGPGGAFRETSGLVDARVYTKDRRAIVYGDRVVLEGMLSRPSGLRDPGVFDYAKYLALKGIYSSLRTGDRDFVEVIKGAPANPVARLAYRLRGAIRTVIDRYTDGPDNAFIKAILIGERAALPDELNDDFIKTGTVHILSISGLHVALIAALVLGLFGLAGIPRSVNLVLTMGFVIFYAVVAGSSAPIVRSAVMFCFVAGAYLTGRQADAVNSLAAAALAILVWTPKALFDPGFQLSFVSVASMIVIAPRLASALGLDAIPRTGPGARARRYLIEGVSVSAAAWIGTMPIVLSYFNTVSFVSIIANLIIVPLSLASMVLAIALVLLAGLSAALAAACAFAVSAVDAALFALNHILAVLPGATVRMATPGAAYILAYYALVALWLAPPPAQPDAPRARKRRRAAFIAVLIFLNLLAWRDCVAHAREMGAMRVTFLDVGLGDAAFVEFPGGGNMLVDAGPGGDEGYDAGRNVIAPFLWNRGVRRIDTLLVSHPHRDHIGGAVYLLRNFAAGTVIDGGVDASSMIAEEYLDAVRSSGARHIRAGAGDLLRLPGGAALAVFSPDGDIDPSDGNEGSLVGRLAYRGESILFCGDVTSVAMERALDRYGASVRSTIMKVPHHGGIVGELSIAKNFFTTVDAKIAIISTARDRRYDWRNGKIATYLPSICYDTSRDGAIILTINEDGRRVEAFAH